MSDFLYRFRSAEALLDGFQELERQEIYFASPEQLNDPLEGFKDFYWSGDEIIWKNLIKHYLLCLEQVSSLLLLSDKDDKILGSDIPIFKIESNFPTPQYQDLFKQICLSFLANPSIAKYPKWLASRVKPIRRHELVFHLRQMHLFALSEIFKAYEERGFIPIRSAEENPLRKAGEKGVVDPETLNGVNELDQKHSKDIAASELFYNIQNQTQMQMHLLHRYNAKELVPQNKEMVFADFPEQYVQSLEKLAHADWYAACFLGSCTNPAMWGYYGNNHTGICLKFKTSVNNGTPFMQLYGMNGWRGSKNFSGPTYGNVSHQFYKVSYSDAHPEIDFFRSLGRPNRGILNASWYRDERGNESVCAEGIFRDAESWRKKYWADFFKCVTTKLDGWAHEDEYRLILSGIMQDFSKPETRKLKFKLQDLEGIIFGMNTTMENKLKIMKIIDSKCSQENYSEFKFYQASFSRGKREMEINELGLIRPNKKS